MDRRDAWMGEVDKKDDYMIMVAAEEVTGEGMGISDKHCFAFLLLFSKQNFYTFTSLFYVFSHSILLLLQ